MNIEIDSIKDSGIIDKERVVFKANQACELGKYIVALSTSVNENSFSSHLRNTFWFPDKELKVGDLVVLYSKKGDKSSIVNEDGSNTHFYYWGLDNPLSATSKACIVLLETSWITKNVPIQEEKATTL